MPTNNWPQEAHLSDPADIHWLIVPDANNDLSRIPKSIVCEAAGTITIRDKLGVTLTYTRAVGDIIPFRGVRITAATGTWYGWS